MVKVLKLKSIFTLCAIMFILFCGVQPAVFAQNKVNISDQKITVKGVVKDDSGVPLPGVNVFIKGTKIGTMTDLDGKYTLSFPKTNKSIVFSMIGMKTVTENVGNRTTIDVVLKDDTAQLSEVVVTGLFTKNKESYTGSVSTIDNKQLKEYKGQNLVQTLRNIDASLNVPVDNLRGSNPNNLPNINIRGNSSLPLDVTRSGVESSVNNPLIILDGFEIPLRRLLDFNDDEIESINILKDASATAIYGSRGANGVIVIVTKQPQAGKLKVQAQAGINLEVPDLSSYTLLNAKDKLELERLVGIYKSKNTMEEQVRYDSYYNNRLRAVLMGVNTDWMSKPLRNGVGQRYNIRLDGGSQEFRWSIGGNYNQVNGVMKGSSRQSFSGDITLVYNIKNLIFRNYTNVSLSEADESKYPSFNVFVNEQPYNAPYDKNGNLIRYFDNTYHTDVRVNPLYEGTLNIINSTKGFSIMNNFSMDWNISKDLLFRGQLSVSTNKRRRDKFLPAESGAFSGKSYQTVTGLRRRGSYDLSMIDRYNYSGNFTLNYNKLLNDKHLFYLGLAFTFSDSVADNTTIKAEGFNNQKLTHISNALQYAEKSHPTGGDSKSRHLGYTANFNYTYDNRYIFDASYRLDGSSDFGANKRFAPFWSVGLGWNVHNETFFKNNYVNLFRLKASVGEVGSLNFPPRAIETTYSYSSSNQYLNWASAQLNGLGNPNLTWQKTLNYNLGFEFAFLKNRINGRLELYMKNTSNLLSSMKLPKSMGFDSYSENVGSVQNKGVELFLNAFLLRNYEKDYRWTVGFQMMYDQNKIAKLSPAIKKQTEEYMQSRKDASTLLFEGYPVNSLWAVQSLGIDPNFGNEIFLDKSGNPTKAINASQKIFLGDSQPPFRGLITSMFYWKGFTINMSFSYRFGGKTINQTLKDRVEVTVGGIANRNVDQRVFTQRWKKPGDVVAFRGFDDTSAGLISSRFVQNDRTLDFQSLGVSYRIDSKKFKQKTKLSALSVSINMSNIATWSSIRMERGLYYPFSRTIMGTISITY